MSDKLLEAVDLFEEIMIYGREHIIKNMDNPIWKEYSPEQIQVLKILSSYDSLSNGKLAEIQGVHKSAVSSRLKKLEEKGLVISERDKKDQRTNLIKLSSAGMEVLKTSNKAVYDNVERLIEGRITDDEFEDLVKTFQKLKEILQMEGI